MAVGSFIAACRQWRHNGAATAMPTQAPFIHRMLCRQLTRIRFDSFSLVLLCAASNGSPNGLRPAQTRKGAAVAAGLVALVIIALVLVVVGLVTGE